MFKVEDILARLQNGEDANDIADEMIKALNIANDQFQKEEEEKAKAAEAQAKHAKKLADLQEIIDLMHDYCIEHYCENVDDVNIVKMVFEDLDAAAVDKMIEEVGAYAVKMTEAQKRIENMLNVEFGIPAVQKLPKEGAPALKSRTADAVIGDFLSSMGLK